jgi:hypothetical protein
VRLDVHTWAKQVIAIFSGLQDDLYGNPLHNFHVVAGGIFRGQEAEERTSGAGDAIDMAFVVAAGRVRVNFDPLADTHVAELRFFEVCGDPNLIEGNNREKLLPGLHIPPDNHGFIHLTTDWRKNFGVLKV